MLVLFVTVCRFSPMDTFPTFAEGGLRDLGTVKRVGEVAVEGEGVPNFDRGFERLHIFSKGDVAGVARGLLQATVTVPAAISGVTTNLIWAVS